MNSDIKPAPTPAANLADALTDIAQADFEIEDINDLDMFAPRAFSLCSSTSSSCSSCCN